MSKNISEPIVFDINKYVIPPLPSNKINSSAYWITLVVPFLFSAWCMLSIIANLEFFSKWFEASYLLVFLSLALVNNIIIFVLISLNEKKKIKSLTEKAAKETNIDLLIHLMIDYPQDWFDTIWFLAPNKAFKQLELFLGTEHLVKLFHKLLDDDDILLNSERRLKFLTYYIPLFSVSDQKAFILHLHELIKSNKSDRNFTQVIIDYLTKRLNKAHPLDGSIAYHGYFLILVAFFIFHLTILFICISFYLGIIFVP
jgi:hypothetical protein